MGPAIPIAGGVAVLGLVGLRLRALAKAKAATAPAAAGTPSSVQATTLNTSIPVPASGNTPFVSPVDQSNTLNGLIAAGMTPQDAAAAVASIAAAAGSNSGDGAAAVGQKAIVTTNDPAPLGDLIIRDAPNATATQIGGAEKDGTVIVLDSSDPTFAQIQWAGGSRLPAATGFARKAFLKLV